MKHIKLFEGFLNEAVKITAKIKAPYNTKEEKKAASNFKTVIEGETITVDMVEGHMNEDAIDLTIQFSNEDLIFLERFDGEDRCTIVVGDEEPYDVWGGIGGYAADTIVEELCLTYEGYRKGELN